MAQVKGKPVLILCDMQNDILSALPQQICQLAVDNARRLLIGARAAGVQVIHVGVCFRKGYLEVSDNNPMFQGIKAAQVLLDGTIGAQFNDMIQPNPDEPVVVKKRVGAHFGTELPLLLSNLCPSKVILAGVSTSGVILSTVRWLADADFRATVVHDCCADRDTEVHNMLCQKVFPRQVQVVDVETVLAELGHLHAK